MEYLFPMLQTQDQLSLSANKVLKFVSGSG